MIYVLLYMVEPTNKGNVQERNRRCKQRHKPIRYPQEIDNTIPRLHSHGVSGQDAQPNMILNKKTVDYSDKVIVK